MNALMLGSMLICGSLHANDWFHGWVDVSGIYSLKTFNFDESDFMINTPNEQDLSYLKLNGYGVEGSAGLVFPIPLYFEFSGGYQDLFSSHFEQKAIQSGNITKTGPVKIDGYNTFYSFEVGYLFQPLSCTPWTIYPFASYTYDRNSLSFPDFPLPVPSFVIVHEKTFDVTLEFNGPSLGFGTNFCLPCDLFVWFEFDWQWRQYINRVSNLISLEVPLVETQVGSALSRETAWLNGPRFKLGADYFFYEGFFVGVEAVYSQLFITKRGKGTERDVTTQASLVYPIEETTVSYQYTTLHNFDTQEFVLKATLGFAW